MMEYLKRKLSKLETDDGWKENVPFPRYYEENGILIKETQKGVKFIIELDDDFNEKVIGQIK